MLCYCMGGIEITVLSNTRLESVVDALKAIFAPIPLLK